MFALSSCFGIARRGDVVFADDPLPQVLLVTVEFVAHLDQSVIQTQAIIVIIKKCVLDCEAGKKQRKDTGDKGFFVHIAARICNQERTSPIVIGDLKAAGQ